MNIICNNCNRPYDTSASWQLCPHPPLGEEPPHPGITAQHIQEKLMKNIPPDPPAKEEPKQDPVARATTHGTGNKYHRRIHGVDGAVATVDVYAVLEAFNVTCPARQHAIKKLLCAGLRNKGDAESDLAETLCAVERAITIERERGEVWVAAAKKKSEVVNDQ